MTGTTVIDEWGNWEVFEKHKILLTPSQKWLDENPHIPEQSKPSTEEKIKQLEQENTMLKAQNRALTERTDFHEEVLTEIILTINS